MDELRGLEKTPGWVLAELPLRKNPIGFRWVFSVKYLSDGCIERYKGRLGAQGYTQTFVIDYCETFTPIAKMSSRRTLIFLASYFNWPL